METLTRINQLLADIARRYPKCWQSLDTRFRQAKGESLPDWPEWCYVPAAATYSVISHALGVDRITDLKQLQDVGIMQALAAWRLTQSVYRFDPDVYQELTETPFSGEIPFELLKALPEWCVYIELDGHMADGAFVTLEHDMGDGHDEVRILFDDAGQLMQWPVHLVGSIEDGLDAMLDYAQLQMLRSPLTGGQQERLISQAMFREREEGAGMTQLRDLIGQVLSLTLYLCSDRPDLQDEAGKNDRPGVPQPVKTKRGNRFFPAARPVIWQAGYRLGRFLRDHGLRSRSGDDTHASPIPHVRRAHWHTYWIGKKHAPEERRRIVKWIPPTPVGFRWENGKATPVIKQVGKT